MKEISVAILIPSLGRSDLVEMSAWSILENSEWPDSHQFLVHFNEFSDKDRSTVDCLEGEWHHFDYTTSPDNQGIPLAYKALTPRIEVDFVLPTDNDMYYLPGWDRALAESIDDPDEPGIWRALSLIEPVPSRGNITIQKDFGRTIDEFRELDLLDWVAENNIRQGKMITMEPQVVRTRDWLDLGGWDTRFWPGFCADPDWVVQFYNRFHGGHPERMHNVPDCLVYHFVEATTSTFIPAHRAKAHQMFEEKWGFSTRQFENEVFRLGELLGD